MHYHATNLFSPILCLAIVNFAAKAPAQLRVLDNYSEHSFYPNDDDSTDV